MLSLHTNNASLSAQNSIAKTQSQLSTSMTRLSTGYRINSAMDDAAGLQIATRLKAQTSGMTVAMSNTQNSTSMLQTAEGAFGEVTNMLVRMKDLATQAADASSNTDDQKAMQAEFDALGQELYNIMSNTTFGGSKLLGDGAGTAGSPTLSTTMTFQIGASSTEKMSIDVSGGMSTLNTALKAVSTKFSSVATTTAGAEISTGTAANTMIKTLADAIDNVGTVRSALGAAANRLDHINSNLSNISTNTKAATGRIMDVDFATESSNMTSSQMLLQAGTAMLKQSNSMSSMVMSLLQ
ncbi:flagellin [Janthinobacterium sp. 75]|uniref:flagellin N-terminal helical domain-containing protein n=1 Tax=Janthinobacterium sp. 75 TaxID=2135628 RepID=UPI001063FE1B|nr:flagellin [Janthinobacterium sp. 75]TDY36183.1 flagellin [Janthinobacterium sp. 75]